MKTTVHNTLSYVFVDFYFMSAGGGAQIFPDCVKRSIAKPFTKCLHHKGGGSITAYIVLEGNIPSEVFQGNLGYGKTFSYTDLTA